MTVYLNMGKPTFRIGSLFYLISCEWYKKWNITNKTTIITILLK